jgi:hypothetical protein
LADNRYEDTIIFFTLKDDGENTSNPGRKRNLKVSGQIVAYKRIEPELPMNFYPGEKMT